MGQQGYQHMSLVANLRQKVANFSNEIQDLLFRMLDIDADKRITAKDALRHPYFNMRPFPVMNVDRTFNSEDWAALCG